MPLIVESYGSPYTKIAALLFPGVAFEYLDGPVSEPDGAEVYCFARAEQDNIREIKYYFNRIYSVEGGKIVCMHKSARQLKCYDCETGRPIRFEVGKEGVEVVDKTAFLPFLRAQEGELVLFPDDSDEV
ncbi:hypothetical protein PAPHI01_1093 [Pancytospora philotis]|nr:hypothetical protein PAPHI01_1093 [Pancytospora philotis]